MPRGRGHEPVLGGQMVSAQRTRGDRRAWRRGPRDGPRPYAGRARHPGETMTLLPRTSSGRRSFPEMLQPFTGDLMALKSDVLEKVVGQLQQSHQPAALSDAVEPFGGKCDG